MSLVKKYESIDQSKLKPAVRDILKKMKDKSENFTNSEINKKVEPALDKLLVRLEKELPEAIKKPTKKVSKPKKEVKSKATKKTTKKTTQTKTTKPKKEGAKEHISTRASKLAKKEGITFKEARARLSKESKEEEKKETKTALDELQKLISSTEFQKDLTKFPKKNKGGKRKLDTDLERDAKIPAKPRGKRTSKSGKTYYEYRDNRSDVRQSGYPYLADGGAIDSLKKDMNSKLDIHSEYYAKGGKTDGFNIEYLKKLKGEGAIKKHLNSLSNEDIKRFNSIHNVNNYKGGIRTIMYTIIDKDIQKNKDILDMFAKGGSIDGFTLNTVKGVVNKPTEMLVEDVTIDYEDGGEIDEIIYLDLYQQLRSKDMFKSNFSTKPKMRKLFNPKNTDSFGSKRPYGISIGENRFILKYYYPNQEFRDDDFETAKKIIASFYNSKSNMAKGGRTISIVNDGVKYNKSKYKAIYGDFDNDGTVNIDDANPLDSSKKGRVEQIELRNTFDKLLNVKAELDTIMYDAVETLDEKAPKDADIYARTKTPYSIIKKLVEKRMLDPKKGLTDMIGTTIAVKNQKELEQVRDDIDGGLLGKVLDRDDFYKTPNAGYRAYHYIVEYKGVPVEVQLKTKNMKKLHEVSHEAYKNGTLNAKSLDSLSKTFMKADKGDAKAKSEISRLLKDKKLLASKISKGSMAKGGKIGFDGLAKKVAKSYEGKPVEKQFQDEYGKTYNKKEAMEVGKKVAGKVYRQQQSMEKGGVMKTYDDFGKDYDSFTDYVMDRISLEERRKIRKEWEKSKSKMQWQDYLLKEVNKKSMAKGGEVIEYSKVYEILKDKIDASVEDIYSTYEQAETSKGEEVESKSRDGFIPFTNGGYSSRWFEYGNMLEGSGMNLPTESLDNKIEEFRERNREYGFERFEEEYPEIVKELGGIENVNYSELEDAGYSNEADDLDMFMQDDDDTVMMEVEAFYYTPNNDRGENGKHTIQLSGVVNLEAPYHRSGNLEDYIEERFTFDSYKELEDKLDKGLAKVVSWFEGDMYDKNPSELKIRRMEKGGKINSVHAVHIKDNMSLLNASKKYSNVKMGRVPIGSLVGQTYVTIDGKRQNLFVGDKYIAKNKQIIEVYKPSKGLYMRLEAGGTLPTPFGQAGLVGETGAMNEMDMFAMGGGLPQGVQQYYGQTYNPAYPTPHGYAKGGFIKDMSFGELYDYLGDNDEADWDNVNSEYIVRMYIDDMNNDGIDVSHIEEVLENNPSKQELYEIWLGNSMETPTPINTKEDLLEALGLDKEFAKGGKTKRSKHSLMQDRRRVSSEPWEVAYQKRKAKMEAGGTLPTPFGQAGLVGETGAMNEMDMFAMGGGLPQGVHQYYAQTYNPAYPTPHGYAKGGKLDLDEYYSKMIDKLGKEGAFERVLKDSQFGNYKGTPSNEFKHNRLPKTAIIGKNSVSITSYTPNTKRYLDSQTFTSPKELAEYLDKNQIYAKGGKTQGYNDKLDESLGNTKGKRSKKEQNYKDRRNESEAMEKKGGKRKYSRVKTMDKGNRKKRQTPMSLAKEIRKEGEKWQDAVKRASAMLKKK